MNGLERFACSMLSCGVDDLEFLDNVGYDWQEVLDQNDTPDGILDFNCLLGRVVDVGIVHIKEAIIDRICELEAVQGERELDDDESKEKEALKRLNPDWDIRGYLNYLNTHVWFKRNESVYRQYLHEAIRDFENNVGICIDNREWSGSFIHLLEKSYKSFY